MGFEDRVPQELIDDALAVGGQVNGTTVGKLLGRVRATGTFRQVRVGKRPGRRTMLGFYARESEADRDTWIVGGIKLVEHELAGLRTVDLVRWCLPTAAQTKCPPGHSHLHTYREDENIKRPGRTSKNYRCLDTLSLEEGIMAVCEAARIGMSQVPPTLFTNGEEDGDEG